MRTPPLDSARSAAGRRLRAARLGAVCAAACAALLAGCAADEGGEPAIDAITIVIPYRPGGGFDRTVDGLHDWRAGMLFQEE